MKNVFKNVFILLFIAFGISSCDVGNDEELNYGNEAFVTQFPFAEKKAFFLKDVNAVVYNYTVPVELVGGNGLALENDITVSFEKIAYVDNPATTADDSYVTAVEGVDFQFVNPIHVLTIPAGSKFATIPIKVISGNLNDQHPPVLVLNLTEVSASGVKIVNSGNKGKINVILQAFCPSDLAGTYSVVTTRLSTGANYTVASESITEIEAGTYLSQTTGNYTLASLGLTLGGSAWNALAVPAPQGGYKFKEVCGRIFVESQNLLGYYSNIVSQTSAEAALSNVNQTTGEMTIYYEVPVSGVIRTYKSKYTPI